MMMGEVGLSNALHPGPAPEELDRKAVVTDAVVKGEVEQAKKGHSCADSQRDFSVNRRGCLTAIDN